MFAASSSSSFLALAMHCSQSLPLLVALFAATIARSETTGSSHCCNALVDAGLEQSLVYPALYPGDAPYYERAVNHHFSKTARLRPECFFQPETSEEISQALKALVAVNKTGQPCQFAVRSGGHMHSAGASGISGGVTFDLRWLTGMHYDSYDEWVSVGAGETWGSVYRNLDTYGGMVTGARSWSVGVSGLTLGGGNSFFAARKGFACDSVLKFEVVLGNGSIVIASKDERPDLFQALKGGSSNFGIVTRITFRTFAGGKIFGGVVLYPSDTADEQFEALVKFGDGINKDPYASAIVIPSYDSATKTYSFMNAYEYTKQVVHPTDTILDDFFAIPGNFSDTTGFRNVTSLAREFDVPRDSRVQFSTLTFKNDIRVVKRAYGSFLKMTEKLEAEAHGPFGVFTLFQPIPTIISEHSKSNGGNVLGLDRFDETLIMYEPYLKWQDEADDALFESQAQWLRDDISSYAASLEAHNEWLYLNYADQSQRPLEGYGAENVAKIRAAAQKYDPEGVFQYMMPGGFKVSHVSEPSRPDSERSEQPEPQFERSEL